MEFHKWVFALEEEIRTRASWTNSYSLEEDMETAKQSPPSEARKDQGEEAISPWTNIKVKLIPSK